MSRCVISIIATLCTVLGVSDVFESPFWPCFAGTPSAVDNEAADRSPCTSAVLLFHLSLSFLPSLLSSLLPSGFNGVHAWVHSAQCWVSPTSSSHRSGSALQGRRARLTIRRRIEAHALCCCFTSLSFLLSSLHSLSLSGLNGVYA